MIFTYKRWGDDGLLIVCGSMWPGANDGAPMPEGYPHQWRSDQQPAGAKRLAEGEPSKDLQTAAEEK